jgi:hypothetical protein
MFRRVDNGLIRHRHFGVKVRVVNPLPRGKLNVGLRLPRLFHCRRPLHAQTGSGCSGVGAQGSVHRGRCPGVGAQGSVLRGRWFRAHRPHTERGEGRERLAPLRCVWVPHERGGERRRARVEAGEGRGGIGCGDDGSVSGYARAAVQSTRREWCAICARVVWARARLRVRGGRPSVRGFWIRAGACVVPRTRHLRGFPPTRTEGARGKTHGGCCLKRHGTLRAAARVATQDRVASSSCTRRALHCAGRRTSYSLATTRSQSLAPVHDGLARRVTRHPQHTPRHAARLPRVRAAALHATPMAKPTSEEVRQEVRRYEEMVRGQSATPDICRRVRDGAETEARFLSDGTKFTTWLQFRSQYEAAKRVLGDTSKKNRSRVIHIFDEGEYRMRRKNQWVFRHAARGHPGKRGWHRLRRAVMVGAVMRALWTQRVTRAETLPTSVCFFLIV